MPVIESKLAQDPKQLDSSLDNAADKFTFETSELPHDASDSSDTVPVKPMVSQSPDLTEVYATNVPISSNNKSTRLAINKIVSKPISSHAHRSGNRIPKNLNTYLRPNAKFVGEQQSGKSKYHIKVEFKTVDLINSEVTGFLQISNLTINYPEISTCFKGEIINNPLNKYKWKSSTRSTTYTDIPIKQYSFITEDKEWGSFPENDLEHWKILSSFTQRDPEESSELSQREDADLRQKLRRIQSGQEDNQFIYMRWKEEFLLPDSRVKQIDGASFEGFYYTVLNIGGHETATPYCMSPGSINGLYYHMVSEKFQSLNLRYVDDEGSSNTFEFL